MERERALKYFDGFYWTPLGVEKCFWSLPIYIDNSSFTPRKKSRKTHNIIAKQSQKNNSCNEYDLVNKQQVRSGMFTHTH